MTGTDRDRRRGSKIHNACNDDPVDDVDRELGLEASAAFRRYVDELRSTWPRNPELAEKHGVAAGNGQFYETNMSANTGENDEQITLTKRRFMQGAAATAALAATGSAAAQEDSEELVLDYESAAVANPFISADVTIGTHKPGYTSALMYEDDDGKDVELPAVVDDRDPNDDEETTANLYGVRADKVAAPAYNAFPRGTTYDDDNDDSTDEVAVKAVDAEHWVTDVANTAGSMTVEDGGDEVDSVRIAASSIASGENATASFDLTAHDAAITSDEDKRHLQVVVNVDQLTAGSVVEIRAVDEDGDYRAGVIDPSGDTADVGTIATSTGSGIVYQVQLADLTVQGSGAGTFNNIQSLEVDVAEADATIELFGIDLERKSKWEYGETVENENTEDEETVTVYEPSGYQKYTDLSGSLLSDATINDLQVPVKYTAAESEEGGSASETAAENYPQFDKKLEQVERIATVTAIDLSHSNLALELVQGLPTERYHALELATGTSNTDDPEDMTWSDVSGSLAGPENTSTLEDLVESGTQYAVRIRTVLTSDEFNSATSSGGGGLFGGGGGGARSSGGGGLFSGATSAVLALIGAGTAYFGFVRKRLPW